jgi:DHA3 family macrolide efflux protein-like MFS transporter
MLATLLPGVLLGPFVGALIDRWNRRIVMIVADGVIALLSAWLAYLFWAGTIQVWHVYAIMLVRAIGGAFHWPAMQASTSLMVPEQHLPRVAGLNQAMGGAVNVVAPPLSAFLLGLLPLHSIMAIDVLTAAFAIAPLFFVHVPQPQRATTAAGVAAHKPTLWVDVRDGLRYVWNWTGLLVICVASMVLNSLINPAMSLVPILVVRHFGGQAMQLGWMNSAWGVGLLAGGLLLSAWGGFRRRIVTALMGTVGLGAGILLVGFTPATAFPLALAGLFFGAAMLSMSNASAFAILQQAVAPEMQGRVFTLLMSLSNAISPLSMAIAGPVADAFGVQAWFAMGGVVCVATGIAGFFIPAVIHLEDNHRTRAVEGEASAPTKTQATVGAD